MASGSNDRWKEHIVLRRLCKGDEVSLKILPKLRKKHFAIEAYRKAFKRINSLYNKRGILLGWSELINDTSLPDKLRSRLRSAEVRRRSLSKADPSLKLPKTYEKLSFLFNEVVKSSQYYNLVELQNELTEKLKGDVEDVNGLISFCGKQIENINALANVSDAVISIKEINRKEYIKSLPNKHNISFLPTGFREFDNKNHGIPRHSFFIISANTGGGKSTVARQLAHNVFQMGGRACIVSMEMSLDENMLRLLSMISGIPTLEIYTRSTKYEKKLLKSWKKFWRKKKDGVATLDFYIPDESITIPQALNFLKPNMYDVVILDYMTLFANIQGKKQHESLDEAGRFCKIWSTQNNCVTVGVAQWDSKEEQIRYSRALQEHASNFWKWTAEEKQKELGFATITQPKARNQKQFPFKLSFDWDTGLVSDYISEGDDYESPKKKKGKNKDKKKKKKGKGKKKISPISNEFDVLEKEN